MVDQPRRLSVKRIGRNLLIGLGVLFVVIVVVDIAGASRRAPAQLRFDKFVSAVKEGRVKKVTINDRSHVVQGTYVGGAGFSTSIPVAFDTPQLLLDYRIPISIDPENGLDWIGMMLSFAPLVILVYFLKKISLGIAALDRKMSDGD